MKNRYQVQFSIDGRNWKSFNAPHSKWDLVDTLEEAKELLKYAKDFHKGFRDQYRYRIVQVVTIVVEEV